MDLRAPKHVEQDHIGDGGQSPAGPAATADLEAGSGNPGSRGIIGGGSSSNPGVLRRGLSTGSRGDEDGEDRGDVVSNDLRQPLLSPQSSSGSIALPTAVSREASLAGSSPISLGARYSGSGAGKGSLRSALAGDWDVEEDQGECHEGFGGDGRRGSEDGEEGGGVGDRGGEGGMSGGRSLRSSSGDGGGQREEWRLGQPTRVERGDGGEDSEREEEGEEEQQLRGDRERAPLLDGRSSREDPGGSARRPSGGAARPGAAEGEAADRSGGSSRSRSGCGWACCAAVARPFVEYGSSWHTYVRQSVVVPCVALALLYMTVLSLGFLMTSYLRWTGLTQVGYQPIMQGG